MATMIRYCCNQADNWSLAIDQVDADRAREPRCLYGPSQQAPHFAFADTRVNCNFDELLASAEEPS